MTFKVNANNKKNKIDKKNTDKKPAVSDVAPKEPDKKEIINTPMEDTTKKQPTTNVSEDKIQTEKTPWTTGDGMPKFEVVEKKETFSPYNEPPIIRDSGTASNQTDNTQPASQEPVLPEPDVTPDPHEANSIGTGSNDGQPNEKTDSATSSSDENIKSENIDDGSDTSMSNVNPSMNALDDADKRKAATAAATEMVNVYCTYKPELFKFIGKTNKKKIKKLVEDGELDMDIELETDDNERKSFRGYLNDIDKQAETIYAPPDDFRDRIIPPLTEVLLKRNIGLTPEQQCLAIVAQDLGASTVQLVGLKRYTATLIEAASDISKQVRINGAKKDSEIEALRKELDIAKRRAEKAERKADDGVPEATIIGTAPLKNNIRIDEGDDIKVK